MQVAAEVAEAAAAAMDRAVQAAVVRAAAA